jgi:DNA processing protein
MLLSKEVLLGLAVFHRSEFFRRWNQLKENEWAFADWRTRLEFLAPQFDLKSRFKLPARIQFVSMLDEEYPSDLFQLPQPPLGIFVEGQLPSYPFVSVVGSRKPTAYSLRMTRSCVKKWVELDFCIVSGGALGIDGEAHRSAIDFGGKTLAVLGGGHHQLHPRRHENLFREIVASGGALISEYPPHFLPRTYTFPERNRIIAALGSELFLAQAHDKSGSLSTARASLDLGRNIFVLRPPAGDENFSGSQKLIDAGAFALVHPDQINQDTSLPRWHF